MFSKTRLAPFLPTLSLLLRCTIGELVAAIDSANMMKVFCKQARMMQNLLKCRCVATVAIVKLR